MEFYDYLEIQPLINNRFLIEGGQVKDEDELRDNNRKIVELGERYGKPVVATCDAHYFDEEEALYRGYSWRDRASRMWKETRACISGRPRR